MFCALSYRGWYLGAFVLSPTEVGMFEPFVPSPTEVDTFGPFIIFDWGWHNRHFHALFDLGRHLEAFDAFRLLSTIETEIWST